MVPVVRRSVVRFGYCVTLAALMLVVACGESENASLVSATLRDSSF